MSRRFHVVPNEDKWALKEEGTSNPLSEHTTQQAAIEEGRSVAEKQQDNSVLIIHRTNGQIRERISFGENGNGNGHHSSNGHSKRETELKPEDVMSVGTRIRWQPIMSGALIAITTMYTLTILASAAGFSMNAHTNVSNQSLMIASTIWAGITLLVSMYLGGLVVSYMTAGEKTSEAVVYGVVVWAAVMILIPILATAGVLTAGWGNLVVRVQEYNISRAEANQMMAIASWITFGTILISLLTAVAGSVIGAGPRITFRNDHTLVAKKA